MCLQPSRPISTVAAVRMAALDVQAPAALPPRSRLLPVMSVSVDLTEDNATDVVEDEVEVEDAGYGSSVADELDYASAAECQTDAGVFQLVLCGILNM